jgi:hypothetical protein
VASAACPARPAVCGPGPCFLPLVPPDLPIRSAVNRVRSPRGCAFLGYLRGHAQSGRTRAGLSHDRRGAPPTAHANGFSARRITGCTIRSSEAWGQHFTLTSLPARAISPPKPRRASAVFRSATTLRWRRSMRGIDGRALPRPAQRLRLTSMLSTQINYRSGRRCTGSSARARLRSLEKAVDRRAEALDRMKRIRSAVIRSLLRGSMPCSRRS